MERIKELDRYQKGLLVLLAVLAVAFCVIYSVVSSRVGVLYHDKILLPSEENGITVYSGTLEGQVCRFEVAPEGTVTFQWGETVYGPYAAREDPTAVPEGKDYLTGVEILAGERIFFRGGLFRTAEGLALIEEDGEILHGIVLGTGGMMVDGEGNVIDLREPSPNVILEMMEGPQLTHKGRWAIWFLGLFCSAVTALSILFADELFRLNLSFRIRDPENADPSDWEYAGRYISWTLTALVIPVIYIMGLQ